MTYFIPDNSKSHKSGDQADGVFRQVRLNQIRDPEKILFGKIADLGRG